MMEDAGAACGPGGEKGGEESKIGRRYEHWGKSTGRGEVGESQGITEEQKRPQRGCEGK